MVDRYGIESTTEVLFSAGSLTLDDDTELGPTPITPERTPGW